MRNLSNEELIRFCCTKYLAFVVHGDLAAKEKNIQFEAELLRRLEAGDRAIETLREIVKDCNKILEAK